jgi:hypothetical protein
VGRKRASGRTDWCTWEERERPEGVCRRGGSRAAAGGTGSSAPARARRKGVGEQLPEVLGVLFIAKEREGRGTWPGATAAAQVSSTGSSGRRR